ncbi:MAG: hypothetical protein Q7P63_10685 [Verrucomicrobiota bacterium JB022]|nr:hypothetical protein [Verrucomicrobiota bacterium JB022]
MSDDASRSRAQLERALFWGCGWALSLLAVYGAARMWPSGEPPAEVAEAPAVESTPVEQVATAEEAPEQSTQPATWAELRPDIGLGPRMDYRRRALLQEILTEESSRPEWITTYVESLPITEYPELLQLLQDDLSNSATIMLAVLFAEWTRQDPEGAVEAMRGLEQRMRRNVLPSIFEVRAETNGYANTVRWAQQQFGDDLLVMQRNGSFLSNSLNSQSFAEQLTALEAIYLGPDESWQEQAQNAAADLAMSYMYDNVQRTRIVDLYEHLPFQPNSKVVNLVVSQLAEQEPGAAYRLLDQVALPQERQEAMQTVFRAQSQRDPAELLVWAQDFEAKGDTRGAELARQIYNAEQPAAQEEVFELTPFELPSLE